jgi:uncharacterized protein
MAPDQRNVDNKPIILSQKTNSKQLINQCEACSPIIFSYEKGCNKNHPNHNHHFRLANEVVIEVPIDGEYTSYLMPSNQAFSVLHRKAKEVLNVFKAPKLMDRVIRQWEQEEDLSTLLSEFRKAGLIRPDIDNDRQLVESPYKLTAWLHLTDRCNLRCAYCYLPHKNQDMSEATGKAAIDATFRSAAIHNYKAVKLKYAGGEPLLRLDLIRILHEYALQQAENKQIELEGVILTNGVLLSKDKIERIRHLNLRIMVSLDGIGSAHDAQRPFKGGTGSFQQTMTGIELLLEKGIYSDISVTVTKQNVDELADLTQWLLEHKLPFTFNLCRENDFSQDHPKFDLIEERIIAGLTSAYKVIETNLPNRSLLASLADQTNLAAPHLHPCSVGHSYLVFDCLGRVSKCQMQIGKSVTSVDAPDPLFDIRQDKEGIQNVSVEDKPECSRCEWKYWCAGGCPLANFRTTGRYDSKSLNCTIYKSLFPEIMRLEGLRLLKYHSPAN